MVKVTLQAQGTAADKISFKNGSIALVSLK